MIRGQQIEDTRKNLIRMKWSAGAQGRSLFCSLYFFLEYMCFIKCKLTYFLKMFHLFNMVLSYYH